MSASRRRKIRERLYKEFNKICHWCKVETVMFNFSPVNKQEVPDNAATVDHIYQKGHPLRMQDSNKKYVLACHKCNKKRAKLQNFIRDEVIDEEIITFDP